MLATVARRFTDFIGREPADIAISELVRQKKGFAAYLRGNRYKPTSVKGYGNYLKMLVARAKDAGWRPQNASISGEWRDFHQQATKAGLRALIEHLSAPICFEHARCFGPQSTRSAPIRGSCGG
jgi:hypothetical protein